MEPSQNVRPDYVSTPHSQLGSNLEKCHGKWADSVRISQARPPLVGEGEVEPILRRGLGVTTRGS
jgi:hypothetical protein